MNKRLSGCLLAAFGMMLATACSNDEDDATPYPSIVTELADLPANAEGVLDNLLTDNGEQLFLTNPQKGYRPQAVYRGMCGYVRAGGTETHPLVRLATLRTVTLLHDSTDAPQRRDPVRVVSAWRGGDYINLMLQPKTQGGRQYWGFRTDSLRERDGKKHWYLSLHHGQNNDPAAYSETLYASLWLKTFTEIAEGDSLHLTATMPSGTKTWNFAY